MYMYLHYDLQSFCECYSKFEFIHFSVQLLIVFSSQKYFMQFSQKIAGFQTKRFTGLLELVQLYKQNPLEKFSIFTIFQNYTLALTLIISFHHSSVCHTWSTPLPHAAFSIPPHPSCPVRQGHNVHLTLLSPEPLLIHKETLTQKQQCSLKLDWTNKSIVQNVISA